MNDDAWPATDALRQQLDAVLPGIAVDRVAETGSTNADLVEHARIRPGAASTGAGNGAAEVRRSVESAAWSASPARAAARYGPYMPRLLVAEHQRAGRGRHGRRWQSAPGASLTFSLALALAATDWAGLSLAVGIAIADALEPPEAPGTGLRIGLKWPNDLWLVGGDGAGRKLGGVLIEVLPRGIERVAVIGVGLNVRPQHVDDASTGVACWNEVDPDASPGGVLARIALPLAHALRRFESAGFAGFAGRYAARDVLHGRMVRTSPPDALDGVAEGVSARGALALRTAAGLHHVESGEVSVRLHDGDGAAASAPASTGPAKRC